MINGMITNQEIQINEDLVDIFACLSEVLLPSVQTGLPEWLAWPGGDWPFYSACIRLANGLKNPQLEDCAMAFSGVPASTLNSRFSEYESLFIGEGRPPIWLYESHYVDGRISGPTSFSIHNIYKEAGLEIAGAELADHAGLELVFLAYLVEKEVKDIEFRCDWKQAREVFTKNHAGRWLPEVGKRLSRSVYPGWSAIGSLIIAILHPPEIQTDGQYIIPNIVEPDLCTLCGFCVQICPTRALRIHEDENSTSLQLETRLCTSCTKCRNVCPENVLSLSLPIITKDQVILRESPRARCSKCGATTYSQAELDYTQRILGNPVWLAYCLNCRSQNIRKIN